MVRHMSPWWIVFTAMAAGSLGVIVTAAIAAGTQADAVNNALREHEKGVGSRINAAVEYQQKEAARWRQRALDCEANGPTVGDVDEVFRENVRLKADVAVQQETIARLKKTVAAWNRKFNRPPDAEFSE